MRGIYTYDSYLKRMVVNIKRKYYPLCGVEKGYSILTMEHYEGEFTRKDDSLEFKKEKENKTILE